MKPQLSNKIISNEKITLVEGEEIIKTDQENAKVLKKPSLNTEIILVLLQSLKDVLIQNSVSHLLKKAIF